MVRDTLIGLAIVLFLCVDGWGCVERQPPSHVSISSEFSDEDRAIIEDSIEAWCERSDGAWCPELTTWTDRGRIYLVDTIPLDDESRENCPKGKMCRIPGKNDGTDIQIARDRARTDAVNFWRTSAHELGHYCTDHLDSGLMSPTKDWGGPTQHDAAIDSAALVAWRLGCGF